MYIQIFKKYTRTAILTLIKSIISGRRTKDTYEGIVKFQARKVEKFERAGSTNVWRRIAEYEGRRTKGITRHNWSCAMLRFSFWFIMPRNEWIISPSLSSRAWTAYSRSDYQWPSMNYSLEAYREPAFVPRRARKTLFKLARVKSSNEQHRLPTE